MSQGNPNIDVNRLKGILNKSKAIMGTVDGGNYKRGNIDKSLLQQDNLVESVGAAHVPQPRQYNPSQHQQVDVTDEAYKHRIQNSKMPDVVKQAMLNNPIPQPDLSSVMGSGAGRTFTLEDLGYTKNQAPQLNEQQVPQQPTQYQQVPQQAPQYQPTPQQPYYPPQQAAPSMSREEVKAIVKECLAEMMVDTITENSVKNTLKALMTEGKIRVKKKQ